MTAPAVAKRGPSHRNILITPAGLALLLESHWQNCSRCRHVRGKLVACVEGRALERDLEASMERFGSRYRGVSLKPKRAKAGELTLIFNPSCTHDRCSYSIAHCAECRRFSDERGK